jgi:outer membrane lipoprotein-sorting protein
MGSSLLAQDKGEIKENFLKRLEEKSQSIHSIESNFVQEKFLEIMEGPLLSSGKFYYKKEELIRWDQVLPSPYYFILNGDKVIRFDGKTRKVIAASNPQVAYFKDFILATVTGSMFESEEFESIFSQSENEVDVVLTPRRKQMKKRINKILLRFAYDSTLLLELIIMEYDGDVTKIYFTNQQINSPIDDGLFK